jgi:hypothetical protein
VVGDTTVEPNETVILTMGTPTNATLGTNTTFTHTIVNDDALTAAAQPSGIFLSPSGYIALSSTQINLYGGSGEETVVLGGQAMGVTLDQNVERIHLSEAASAYWYQQTGNRINVYRAGTNELVVKAGVQSDADGTVLVFGDGTGSVMLQSGVMRLGGAVVSTGAAAGLVRPVLTGVLAAPSGASDAGVYLGSDASFTAASSGLKVYGSAGSETLNIGDGVGEIVADQGIEAVRLGGGLSGYRFQQTGNKLNVYDQAGTKRVLTVPVQGDADGTQVAFGGVSYGAKLSAGVMKLGEWVIPSDAPGAISALTEVQVSASGSGSAANGDMLYRLAAGSYRYGVAGFGRGDVLDFPAGAVPTVNNESYTDGDVEIQWASSGQAIVVTLTGLNHGA